MHQATNVFFILIWLNIISSLKENNVFECFVSDLGIFACKHRIVSWYMTKIVGTLPVISVKVVIF